MTGSEFRPLAQWERDLLDRLLEADFPGRDEVREQLASCLVREYDEHGCLEFAVQSDVKAPVEMTVPVEVMADDADGIPIELLLFVKDGKVSELEFNKADGSPIIRMPSREEWRRLDFGAASG
jgi:hypothetical protein